MKLYFGLCAFRNDWTTTDHTTFNLYQRSHPVLIIHRQAP